MCVVCGKTHRQHCLVVTPVTSSVRDTPPPVSSTAVIICRGRGGRGVSGDCDLSCSLPLDIHTCMYIGTLGVEGTCQLVLHGGIAAI